MQMRPMFARIPRAGILAGTLAAALTACGGGSSATTSAAPASSAARAIRTGCGFPAGKKR